MLRVGVVIDTFQQPAWARRVLEAISSSNFAAIAAVLIEDRPNGGAREPIARKWYSRLDAARFRQPHDAFDVADVRPLLGATPIVSGGPSDNHHFDVVLSFVSAPAVEPSARHGIWWVTDNAIADFAAEEPVTTAEVHVSGAGEGEGILGRAQIGTDRISLHRTLSRLYWKVATLLVRELETAGEKKRVLPLAEKQSHEATNTQVVRAAARAAVHEAAQKFRDSWMREQWFIAFRFGAPDEDPTGGLSQFQPIIPPRDRLWADPFVVVEEGRTFVFVEEMFFRFKRGAIAYLELRPDGTWSQPHRVLERPYHLSYPCVFRWRGEYYMVPETSQNRTIELYRCTSFPDRWEFATELMRDMNAVDSTIFELSGLWWMYTSTASVGRIFDELSIYYAESPLGPWHPHRMNPVRSHVLGGRCGGSPFIYRNAVYRAAQNSARRYGHSMQVREIVELTPERWEEREVAIILPNWRKGLIGTHTMNRAGGVTVIDGLRYRWSI